VVTERGPNHYEVLGLPADASDADVRRAYRERAKTAHPDAGGQSAAFRRLLDAYQVLSDRDLRRAYDERLGIRRLIDPTSGGAARASWTGTKGDFSGDVQFPGWMRNITDAVWRPGDPGAPDRAEGSAATAPGETAVPADVVWWYPEPTTAAPIVAGQLVVLAVGRRLVALSAELGSVAWEADLGREIVGAAASIGDLIVAWTVDGTIHAVEMGRGVTRWARLAGPPASVGVLATDSEIVVAGADGRVLAFEPSDGRLRWIAKVEGPPSTSLSAGAGIVLCPTTRQTLEAIDMTHGRHRWRLTVRPALDLPACPVGETVWLAGIAGAGSLVRIGAATGAPAGSFAAGRAVAGITSDGSMLIASVAGPPRLLAVGEGGRLHLDVTLPHVAPEPAIDGYLAFLADPDGAIVVIDLRTARVVRTASVPFDPVGPPILTPQRIIVRARDGRIWATTRPELHE
jgi:hypothetical protein